jgi:hypothetical protein
VCDGNQKPWVACADAILRQCLEVISFLLYANTYTCNACRCVINYLTESSPAEQNNFALALGALPALPAINKTYRMRRAFSVTQLAFVVLIGPNKIYESELPICACAKRWQLLF